MELLISILIGILTIEAYAWLPQLSHWLIDRAVERLRKEDQVRCREEWRAGLATLPNTIVRLAHAISCIGAATKMNNDFFENKLSGVDVDLDHLRHKHSQYVVSYREAKKSLGR